MVNQTQHTPGPWHVEIDTTGSRFRYVIRASENTHVCEVNYHAAPQNIGSLCDLIAAAPELLEALEALRNFANRYGYGKGRDTTFEDWQGYLQSADEAINKARGVLN